MRDFIVEWAGTPNFSNGRKGRKPIVIVDHITTGLYPGTLHWMQNPTAKASAHYLVTKTGLIFQMVKDEDTAWANGVVNKPNWPLYDGTNPNRYTLTIEHEGLAGDALTEEQYQASLWLHKKLIQKWHIAVTEDTIIGHYRIDGVNRVNCPGPNFPWKRLFEDLNANEAEPLVVGWKEEIMQQATEAGLITSAHQADEPAPKWFVLAVVLNALKRIEN
ncbi:MAG: N-acetylmuramoyl-L-alanine amidase [Bacillota bacterium]|nr:N-acetylmuramoyl-L-alanine amidase [Bacillota bacterium]